MINYTSRGTTIINPTMDDMTKMTPVEDLLYESDEDEDATFNSLSTCVFDGRKSTFVSLMINEMVPMNKNA